MIIYYRLSDGSYPKIRFENATKEKCLRNFLSCFNDAHDQMYLILDNVKDKTFEYFTGWVTAWNFDWEVLKGGLFYHPPMTIEIIRTQGGSSAGSFRIVLQEALKLKDDELVYFVEDDYAHLFGSRQVLLEGLDRAHYVTLYNHPDKYLPASQGGNPLIGDDGAEATKVFVTDNSYWMMTNSTTMTFATMVGTLREDKDVWLKHTEGTYPQDMNIFLELRQKGRGLIQPIPTKATHCEPAWAAKLIGTGVRSWDEVLA